MAEYLKKSLVFSLSGDDSVLYSVTVRFKSPCNKWVPRTSKFDVIQDEPLTVAFNNPYPTAFPYGNGMVLHFYQQQESSTTKTVHKVTKPKAGNIVGGALHHKL